MKRKKKNEVKMWTTNSSYIPHENKKRNFLCTANQVYVHNGLTCTINIQATRTKMNVGARKERGKKINK